MTGSTSRRFFGISILIFAALICIFLFLHSSFFNIEEININGLEKVTEDEVVALSGLSTGVNIFEVNNKLCATAITIHPMIKSAKIVRHLPRELEVQVFERKIWALVPYQDIFLCIDEEGICIDKINNLLLADYPIITMDSIPERMNLGQLVESEGISEIKAVWDSISEDSRKQVSEFHYVNEAKEILIYTIEGTEVRFGGSERLEEKTRFFGQVFEIEKDLQKEGTDALEYVDLRFKGQPVIKTKA